MREFVHRNEIIIFYSDILYSTHDNVEASKSVYSFIHSLEPFKVP